MPWDPYFRYYFHLRQTFLYLRRRTFNFFKIPASKFLLSGRTACNFAPLCLDPSNQFCRDWDPGGQILGLRGCWNQIRKSALLSQNPTIWVSLQTGIRLPLPVLLLPAVNCRCKTNSRFKFTGGRLPVYICLW